MKRLVLTLTVLAGPAWVGGKTTPPRGPKVVELKEARLRAELPAWEKSESRRPKVYSVVLAAPAEGDGPGMRLSLEHYAPGNPVFADADAFLAQQTAPAELKVKGRLIGRPLPIKAGKSKARHWFREARLDPSGGAPGKSVDMETETVLVDGTKKGFYVLSYTAPKSRFLKNRKAFQRALDTFEIVEPTP